MKLANCECMYHFNLKYRILTMFMHCIISQFQMPILSGLGLGMRGGGAYANALSVPTPLSVPLPAFERFHNTSPGALTRVGTVCTHHTLYMYI